MRKKKALRNLILIFIAIMTSILTFGSVRVRNIIIFVNVIYLSQKMFNEQGKLIVIHEYQPAEVKPFLNPICKGTYEALPRIYGKQTKKKYQHDHDFFREAVHMRCLRECCARKHGHQRTETHVGQGEKIKNDHYWSTGKDPKKYQRESKNGTKMTTHKKQKIALPNLKTFQTEELAESQTKHKVCRPIGGVTSLDIQSIAESRGKYLQCLTPHQSKERNQSLTNSNESVQTEEKYFGFSGNQASFRQRTKTQGDKNSNMRYYEYLQNDPKFKPQKEVQFRRANTNKQTSDGDSLSISSSTIRQRKDSTMFQKFKIKQALEMPSKRSTKAYSVLSNGLFPIPEEEEFQDYLSKYKPLDPEFDVGRLVKQPDFHIVPADGKVFFGQIKNKKKHGSGISVSEKEIYEGTYEQDVKTYGCEKNRDGVYRGEYLKGKRHGKGTFSWVNGQTFEGEWKHGKKNGFGIWKSPKGDYYEGQWAQNRQNGQGYFYHIGGSKYRGEFKDFLKHGQGQEEFSNGDKYTGEYALGKPHGKGTYTWKNGDTYQGSFSDGSRSGTGLLKRVSGQIYEGEFRNDMKHGRGQQKFKSGESFKGEYREGERWKGTLRTSQGKIIELTE